MMNKDTCIIIIFIMWIMCNYHNTIYADEKDSLQFILTLNPIRVENPETTAFSYNLCDETNEAALLMALLFKFYKTAISSQDRSRCGFYPSCSEFGILAIKKYGLIRGMIMAADRLLRCNGMDMYIYTIHKETGKYYDPVY